MAAEPLYDLVLTHLGYAKGKPYPRGGGVWDLPDGSSIGISPTTGANAEREHDRYSITAQRNLHDSGLDSKASRKVVDMVAASILLQSWLDGARTTGDADARR